MFKFQLKHAVFFVFAANLLYFLVEFYIGRQADSVSLFADSIDFLEDAAVNFIVLISLYLSQKAKKLVTILLAFMLLIPASAAFYTAGQKLFHASVPISSSLAYTALGALLVNMICALLLAEFQHDGGSLSKAAFLSSRNDAIANCAMIVAAVVTMFWASHWPDLIVGVGIALINLDSAKEILQSVKQSDSSPFKHRP